MGSSNGATQGAVAGGTAGATAGSVAGPWGTVIGGAAGALGGGLYGWYKGTNGLWGGTKQVSTQTKGQSALLKQLAELQGNYNPYAYEGLAGIAANPNSSYAYDADNGAAAFKAGVTDPALQQLDNQIADTQHSSMLHSSANRNAQDTLRQNTMNNINNLSYQDQLKQQQLRQQAQEEAYGRQMSALGGLMSGNKDVLGTEAVALKKKPGLLDALSAGAGLGSSVKGMFK